MGIDSLKGVAIAFVVVALIVALGAQMLGEAQDDMTASSVEYNATQDGLLALGKISGKLGIIATAVTLIIVILIIVVATKRV